MSQLEYARLPSLALPLVNKFYNAHSVRGRANKQDAVWVAKEQQHIVAAARVRYFGSTAFLCGVFVAPKKRQQGVASALIQSIHQAHPPPIFTFIYEHLQPLYQGLGYQKHTDVLVDELQLRLDAYRRQGRNISPYFWQG